MSDRRSFQRKIQPGRKKGASLLETMVALSILPLALFAIYLIYETGSSTHARGVTDVDLQDNGRRALEEMAKMIRMAGSDPTGSGLFGFRSAAGFTPLATEKKLLFSLDADKDGVIDSNTGDRVGFALFGTELKRTMDGTTAVAGLPPIARNVQSLIFKYFDASDGPIPDPPGYALTDIERAAIRRIQISLTLFHTVPGQGSRVFTLSTDVRPRNL